MLAVDNQVKFYHKVILNTEGQTHIVETPQPTCWRLVRKVPKSEPTEVEEVVFILHGVILAKRLPQLTEMSGSVMLMPQFKKSPLTYKTT